MPVTERLDYSQPANEMSAIADEQRNKYSAVNKDATSDGDEFGKGTGVFLDTVNGGSSIDNAERKNEIKLNEYQKDKPYTTPSA